MKKVLLLCNLILCGCVDNARIINAEKDTVSVSQEGVKSEEPVILSDYGDGSEIKILNYELNDSFNISVMKNCLTKEEIQIIRDIERKFNKQLYENSEYAYEQYTESLDDFQKYTSISLKAFNEVLKIHGYKTPDEATFYKKIEEIYGEDYHHFFESPDFLTSITDFESVKENHSVLEYADQLSSKYRMVWFRGLSNSKFFSFEKKDLYKDAFGLEYEKYDENSDIILDIKDLKSNIYANLYVFNDNKAAKVWLMNNDLEFFSMIHCYEDREINETKLKNYLRSVPDDYETYDIFKDRSLTDHLWAGQDIFDLVQEKTDSAIVAYEEDKSRKLDIKAFDLLAKYLFKYKDVKYNGSSCNTDPYFVKKACNFAMMEVSLNKKHSLENKNGYFNMESTSISYRLFNDELLDVAKKENYFNIKSFDEVLKVIEWDKEHDPQGSNDYYPFDYTTLHE